MEAIHTAISPINCISGPRDYRRQMVDRLHLNEGFSVIRGDFLCTYLFPRLWRGPGQCGLSSLQKMELGTGQADAHTPRPTAQFSKCQAKSAPPAHYIGCWHRFSLLYSSATRLLSDSFVAAFTAEKKGLRFSGLWCLAN